MKTNREDLRAVVLSAWAYWEREGGEKYIKKRIRELGYNVVHFIDVKETDAQAIVMGNQNETYIAVRGTTSRADWANNVDLYSYDGYLKRLYLRIKKGKKE